MAACPYGYAGWPGVVGGLVSGCDGPAGCPYGGIPVPNWPGPVGCWGGSKAGPGYGCAGWPNWPGCEAGVGACDGSVGCGEPHGWAGESPCPKGSDMLG